VWELMSSNAWPVDRGWAHDPSPPNVKSAPAAAQDRISRCLVQRVLGRRLRELSHHNKAIRAADLHGGGIGAEVGDAIEAAFCETALQLLSRPTSHHELVVAGTFLTFVDEDMPLGHEKASVLPIDPQG
jgi:hypothetical protein